MLLRVILTTTFMICKSPLKFAFLSLLFFSTSGCNDDQKKLQDYEEQLDSLSAELSQQKERSDSLTTLLENGDIGSELPVFYGRKFDAFENPEEFI